MISLSFIILSKLPSPSPQLIKVVVAPSVIQEIVADISDKLLVLISFGVEVGLAPILKTWFILRKKTPAKVPARRMIIPISVGILFFLIILCVYS